MNADQPPEVRAARTTARATILAAVLSAAVVIGVTVFQDRTGSPASTSTTSTTASTSTTTTTTTVQDTTVTTAPDATELPAIVERAPGAPCPQNYLCLYRYEDFSGAILAIQADTAVASLSGIRCEHCSEEDGGLRSWNDEMGSWWNSTDSTACWFSDADHNGSMYVMDPRRENPRLGLQNDIASSIAFGDACDSS